MRVAITGSTGLIGSALARALGERGDQVVRFVRPSTSLHESSSIRWDPSRGQLDEGDLFKIGGVDAAVNLAGAGIADRRWDRDRKDAILHSRVRSTELLVQAISSMPSGCATLVSGSAVGYYGSRSDEVLDESSGPGQDFLAQVCQRWEEAADPIKANGTTVTYLRTGIVMSSNGGALKKQLPLFRVGLGGRLSNGRQWTSPISLADEVRAILWIIDHGVEGPVNLTSPGPLTNRDLTAILAHELNRPAFLSVPTPALKVVLGSELVDQAILASQRVIPSALVQSGFEFHHANARSIIHWALHEESKV
ncbi:MAG: TIGR01777 family protein [Acidimicrobiaceae bacterium]|nr:TIGR01777 family protein [Acidimicrobiaceae bacterium]